MRTHLHGPKIMVCPIQHLFWVKLWSVLLEFKRKHSTATSVSTWKVMDIPLNISRVVKTGLSTLEIPCMDPGSSLKAGTPMLVWTLCCSGPPVPTLWDNVGCQNKNNVCQFLIFRWVKCLLNHLALFIDSRNIKRIRLTSDSILLCWYKKGKFFLFSDLKYLLLLL